MFANEPTTIEIAHYFPIERACIQVDKTQVKGQKFKYFTAAKMKRTENLRIVITSLTVHELHTIPFGSHAPYYCNLMRSFQPFVQLHIVAEHVVFVEGPFLKFSGKNLERLSLCWHRQCT